MNTIYYPANKRGYAKHDWLESYFSFSFADYYNPNNIHFGALRVLNDDIINPNNGFGMHPHDNMEIITIVLEGKIEHKDSIGNSGIITKDEIQVMSAGKGIMHSEKNPDLEFKTKLLQLWIFSNKKNIEPRYQQKKYFKEDRLNKLQLIVSPNNNENNLWIYQDAWLYLSDLELNKNIQFDLNDKNNGVYLFVIEGSITINSIILKSKDALGITNSNLINITSLEYSKFLLIELPL